MPEFVQGQGALSYTFFNLSGQNCVLTPKGAGPNPAAYSSWGQSNGWLNSGDYDVPGLFNPSGIPYEVGSNITYFWSKKGTSDYFTSSYVFFDWPYSPIASTQPPGQLNQNLFLNANGSPVSLTLNSAGFNNWTWNTPGMADSWLVTCSLPSSQSGVQIAIANLATSQNALQSGNTGFYVFDPYLGQWLISGNYWYPAFPGWFANSDINPVAEGNPNQTTEPKQPCYGGVSPAVYSCSVTGGSYCLSNQNDFTNPDSTSAVWPANPNPCGAGFTAASPQSGSMIFNWNPPNSKYGGLWTGINYANYTAVSPYPAVLNINMPMLPVNLSAYVVANTNNPGMLDPAVTWSPVMGGHFSYVIGDPFLISSFAAKILAYLATNQNAQLNDASDFSSISNSLTSLNNSVFPQNSVASNYVQWLLGSQSSSQNYPGVMNLAAQAYKGAFNSVTATQHESIWGEVFQVLADSVIKAIAKGISKIPDGKVAGAAVYGFAAGIGNDGIIPQVNSAIAAAFTTTNQSMLPLSNTAPAVVNPTYSSSNLLGLLMLNAGVQAAINDVMGWKQTSPNPWLSNFTAYFEAECTSTIGGVVVNSLQLNNNLVIGGNTNVPAACGATSGSTPPTYTNVFPGTNQPAITDTLSIWTAILTGSDIIVNEGYLQLGDSADGNAPFQPPTLLYFPPSTSTPNTPTTLPFNVLNPAINTTFNLNTFTLTVQSVQWNITPESVCQSPGAPVNGASQPTCEYPLQTAVSLNYMTCVSDVNATGGVIASISSSSSNSLAGASVQLACACIPSYISGSSAQNPLTGASSVNPATTCQ